MLYCVASVILSNYFQLQPQDGDGLEDLIASDQPVKAKTGAQGRAVGVQHSFTAESVPEAATKGWLAN